MQGYILNIAKVKDEDLIVTLLTEKRLKTLYRFYGARHANINLGFKIDFEIQTNAKSSIGMLRNVLHLSNKWMMDSRKFYIWQQFIKLFYQHLKEIEEVDPFYIEILDEMNKKFSKQNPIRCTIESYLKILEFEGRLHDDFICFLCEEEIKEEVVLTRGYLCAHKRCLYGSVIKYDKLEELFNRKSTLFLSDIEIEVLWKIIQEGL